MNKSYVLCVVCLVLGVGMYVFWVCMCEYVHANINHAFTNKYNDGHSIFFVMKHLLYIVVHANRERLCACPHSHAYTKIYAQLDFYSLAFKYVQCK